MLEIKTVTNGPITKQGQRICHDTLPWLISFSLDDGIHHGKVACNRSETQIARAAQLQSMVDRSELHRHRTNACLVAGFWIWDSSCATGRLRLGTLGSFRWLQFRRGWHSLAHQIFSSSKAGVGATPSWRCSVISHTSWLCILVHQRDGGALVISWTPRSMRGKTSKPVDESDGPLWQNKFSMFAMTPCRGLSPSR